MQQAKANGSLQKVGNVNVQIGDKEGIYAGSATNMARLFREAKEVVDKMINESKEHPKGERWDKETVLKVFSEAGYPTSNAKYSENGVYWAMNMVYSDFHPLHKDDVSKYIEHAYLFLNDKDYSGKYAKEKWYAKKRA